MYQRWHDSDPTMALAVKMLEKTSPDVREYCASFMIEDVKSSGILLDTEHITEKFNCFWRRWQDDYPAMFEAMEYLKLADYNLQKEISLKIIDYIRSKEPDTN